jgi:3-hydroxyisobutyrate dehydrogenase-like beta-hydroxyacid dehydrogenase
MKIGFIGVGRMGSAIAGRLKDAGLDLTVYDSSPDMMKPFAAAGVPVAADLKECCGERDIVITMLPDDAALEQVTLGSDGICDSLPAGSVHMMMGTHGPAASAPAPGAMSPLASSASPRRCSAGRTLLLQDNWASSSAVLLRPRSAASR